jgi:hypothetical protein
MSIDEWTAALLHDRIDRLAEAAADLDAVAASTIEQ